MLRQYELVDRVVAYDPQADEAALNRAYVFGTRKHGNLKRASGDPYFSHPIEVAGILTELRLDTATIITGLLHDTIEDTDTTVAEIEELFGKEVANLVDGVTKLSRLEWDSEHAKQAENFRKFLLAMSSDIRVLLVKLADRLHNMRTLQYIKNPEKRKRIATETMEIYAPLAERIGIQDVLAYGYLVLGVLVIFVRSLSRVLFFNPGRDVEYRVGVDVFGHLLGRFCGQQRERPTEKGDEDVVVAVADDDVAALATDREVAAAVAGDEVVAFAAHDDIITLSAAEPVIARAAKDVDRCRAGGVEDADVVIAIPAVDDDPVGRDARARGAVARCQVKHIDAEPGAVATDADPVAVLTAAYEQRRLARVHRVGDDREAGDRGGRAVAAHARVVVGHGERHRVSA